MARYFFTDPWRMRRYPMPEQARMRAAFLIAHGLDKKTSEKHRGVEVEHTGIEIEPGATIIE